MLHVALLIQVSAKVLAGLVFEELHRYAVCVAVHPAHPLARARKVGLEQVVNERLIAYTLADYPEYHSWLSDLFAPLKRPPQIAEEHDSSTSLIASVEAGRGVALVQQDFDCLTGPRLKILPIIPAPPAFVVGIVYRKDANSPATTNFVAAAKRAK
jgi:DNA-binding transcriptional LysR family regulator